MSNPGRLLGYRLSSRQLTSRSNLSRELKRLFSAKTVAQDIQDPRWLQNLKGRIGKCISFGCRSSQIDGAGQILSQISKDWRRLLIGIEGFLASTERAGLLRQAVVWGDHDSMGHVNNVVYNKWAESGRIEWVQNFARTFDTAHAKEWRQLWTSKGDGMILRSIKTDFKFPVTYPDRISVFHKLSTPVSDASDAFILEVIILSERHRRIAARCTEDIVLYDYQNASKVALGKRPFMLKAFEDLLKAQNAETEHALRSRSSIEEAVRRLEEGSWDRPDAREDLGSS